VARSWTKQTARRGVEQQASSKMVRRKQSKKRPAHVVVQSLRLPQLLLHFLANKCAWWKKRTPVQSKQPPPTTKAVVHNMGSHCGQQWRSQRSRTQPIITLGGRNNPHQKCCARYMKHVVQAIGRKWLVLVWWCPSQGHLESFGIQTKLLHTNEVGIRTEATTACARSRATPDGWGWTVALSCHHAPQKGSAPRILPPAF